MLGFAADNIISQRGVNVAGLVSAAPRREPRPPPQPLPPPFQKSPSAARSLASRVGLMQGRPAAAAEPGLQYNPLCPSVCHTVPPPVRLLCNAKI